MRLLNQLVCSGLLFLSLTAHAVPVPYAFSGEIVGGSGPFSIGATLNASFDYDASTVATATDVDGAAISPPFANYGLFSIYLGGISNFVANIAGAQFGIDSGAVLVGDGFGDPLSGIFASGGGNSPGWTGLSINGFDLVQFTMFTVGTSDMLADQSMPTPFPYFEDIAGGQNSGLNMVFRDASGARHVQNIWGNAGGNVSIGPRAVPEPATLALFLAGLLPLLGMWRPAAVRRREGNA